MKKKKLLEGIFVQGGMDVPFFLLTLALLAFGLVMLMSASHVYAFYNTADNDSFYFIKRQAIFAVGGVIAMYIISRCDYKILRRFVAAGMLVSWALLIYCILKPGDEEIKRRIDLGLFSFQPSEIAKYMIILLCADGLDRNHKKVISNKLTNVSVFRTLYEKTHIKVTQGTTTLFFYAFFIGATAMLVFLGSHLSGAILILLIGVAMLWMGEGRARWFGIGLVVVSVVVLFAMFNYEQLPLKEYMIDRIKAWRIKDYDPQGARWQINHSLYALGSGGFLGAGLGNSKQKYLYVSESHTDFIFSIIGEELGFVGSVILLVLFAALIIRGIYIGMHAKDRFGALLAFGMVAQLGLQVMFNVAVVSDLVPNTGISLPFFSYGGSALLITLAEMGTVLSVSRQADLPKVYTLKRNKAQEV